MSRSSSLAVSPEKTPSFLVSSAYNDTTFSHIHFQLNFKDFCVSTFLNIICGSTIKILLWKFIFEIMMVFKMIKNVLKPEQLPITPFGPDSDPLRSLTILYNSSILYNVHGCSKLKGTISKMVYAEFGNF